MASGDSLITLDALSNRPPTSNYASVDLRNGFVVLDFDDTANETALFLAVLPSHYSGGSLAATAGWTTTSATTGNVKLRIEVTRIASDVSFDTLPAADGMTELSVGAPATAGELAMAQTATFAAGDAAAGDMLLVSFTRLASDAGDTIVGDFELVSLVILEA